MQVKIMQWTRIESPTAGGATYEKTQEQTGELMGFMSIAAPDEGRVVAIVETRDGDFKQVELNLLRCAEAPHPEAAHS